MSSSRKFRQSKKPKKSTKKSQSADSNAEPQKFVASIDDDDYEPRNRITLPFYFRPASIKFRKKRTKAIAVNHRRSTSLPSIPIADETYEVYPLGKLNKLTTLYNTEDVEVIDYRCDNNSEDELLQLWYEESRLEARAYNSDGEIKSKTKPFVFADIGGDRVWLDETIAEPYAGDATLRDQLTRPYFDAEYESFKRQNWIQVSHERATHLPRNRQMVFQVLTKNRPRNIITHLRLGYCVTYVGPCPFGQTCQNYCSFCCICRHQYHCSCRKNKRYGWCWHMHAAILRVGYTFKEELTVYVANSSRFMQLAHIRASCYDSQQNVNQIEQNLFQVFEISSSAEQVNFTYLVQRLAGRQKCKCPSYKRCPECDICGHMYSCNCIEYQNGNLCEHCHLIAMHLSRCIQNDEKSNGEFYYLSDCSDEADEKDEQMPGKGVARGKQIRQVLMMHERSNSISLRRIEAFLELPDNMLCFSLDKPSSEEPWFIEDYGLYGCDCMDLAEAVVCPFCRLCDHEMSCFCSPAHGYCCKHLHAIKRFLKVQFNANIDKCYGDETKKKDLERLLLETRQKREIGRQRRRNRSNQIQNVDLMWKDTSEKRSVPNELLEIRLPSAAEFSIEFSGDALRPDSEKSPAENECVEKSNVSCISSFTIREIDLQTDLPKRISEERNEPKSSKPHFAQAEASTQNNLDFTDLSIRIPVINEELKISSAPESTKEQDCVTDFRGVPREKNVSELQASQKSTSTSGHKARLEENLAVEQVATKLDDLEQKIQFSTDLTDKREDNICKEGTFQEDLSLCEDGLIAVMVEQKETVSQSAKDTKHESEIIKINKPEIYQRTMEVCCNRADVSTQTDPADRITVSTQTSDINYVDETTSNAATAMEHKKKRITKTQRKQLKQFVDSGSLPQISNKNFKQNEVCTSETLVSSSSLEISENNANESKELSLKA